jgi:hypothetical protein
MHSKDTRAMSRLDWAIIGLTIATILGIARMVKSAEKVRAWGPEAR